MSVNVKHSEVRRCACAANLDRRELGAHSASLGVRGLIWDIGGIDLEARVLGISQALQKLSDLHVRRVHILLSPSEVNSVVEEAAVQAGFKRRDGETLFIRDLTAGVEPSAVVSDGYEIRNGEARDLIKIGLELQKQPELAFENWEYPLVTDCIARPQCFFKVIEHNQEIVGISIGGAFDDVGTISHTWVHPEHRWRSDSATQPRLGRLLSAESLQALYESGARRVHLMTTLGNTSAEMFWKKQGFVVSEGGFLEIDI